MVWELLSEVRAYKLDLHPGLLQGGSGEEGRVGVEHDNVLPCHTKGKGRRRKRRKLTLSTMSVSYGYW